MTDIVKPENRCFRDFSYLWLSPKVLCLGNENKIRLLFCISLDFPYLCTVIAMKQKEHQVVISLASNEEQERNMQAARELLDALLTHVRYTEEIWTEPVNSHRREPYLNQLCQAQTQLGANLLGEVLKEMEHRLGRTHNEEGIVVIDLDILQYDDQRMHLRDWDREYVKKLIVQL